MVNALMQVGAPSSIRCRGGGHGIKHFIAAHELIHVCGLLNSDHTHLGATPICSSSRPQPDSGPFSKPDEDRILLHLTSPKNVVSPPIFLKKATADLIKNNWS
jgi:hypothetical protein